MPSVLDTARRAINKHGRSPAAIEACPPIGIVFRLEEAIAALFNDPKAARRFSGAPIAMRIDAIADEVFRTWAPGVDPLKLLDDLGNDSLRRRPHSACGAPTGSFGWTPRAR